MDGRCLSAIGLQIGDHAHDFVPGARLPPLATQRADPGAHGIPADHAHERLVDHDRPARRSGVRGMQAAAGHNRGAKRVVKAGSDGGHRQGALVQIAVQASRRRTVLLDFDRHELRLHTREPVTERHVRHTRLLTQPPRQFLVGQ